MAKEHEGTGVKEVVAMIRGQDFVRDIVADDLESGRHSTVVTRFPPEPNGYLHIGHAKAICLNFGLAGQVPGGVCHLRMDDTNPLTEDTEYVESIQGDVRWLGFDWADKMFYASDYFDQLYAWAEALVMAGHAYVCDQNEAEMRATRGSVTEAGTPSPYRSRSPEENLDLLRRMKAGDFPEGARTLRAKIDMASPNMKMRDPTIYRIRHATHHRTGDAWCLYPIYDFAHGLSDAIEGITHSICTLEFENNRELYDWYVDHCDTPATPRQYEFARLHLTYTVLSKRKLIQLVTDDHVNGWDDPRMPTIAGIRRRGVSAASVRAFCERIGVAKTNSLVDVALLDHEIRSELNPEAPRVMGVLDPLRLIVETVPEGTVDLVEASLFPHDVPKEGVRPLPFTRELFIERADFSEDPPKGFRRLAPGREVRLRYGYLVTCTGVDRDPESGEVVAVRCTHDPETRGGNAKDGRKVSGTIHWVSATEGVQATVRVYDRLFVTEEPGSATGDPLDDLNPESMVVREAVVEPWAAALPAESRVQFERQGYFFIDPVDSTPGAPVFHRIVPLKDSWGRKAAEKRTETTPTPALASPPEGEGSRRRKKAVGASRDAARAASVELSAAYERVTGLGIPESEARALTTDLDRVAFFDAAHGAHADEKAVASWLVNRLVGRLDGREIQELPFDGGAFGRLVALVADGGISGKIGGTVLDEMLAHGGEPAEIVDRLGLKPITDPAELRGIVDAVVSENADAAARYRAGQKGLRGFFVGQVMQRTGGKADPRLTAQLVGTVLDGPAPGDEA